jgi:stage II sporulation protein D
MRRRLSREGLLILLIAAFVLFVVIFSAVGVWMGGRTEDAGKPDDSQGITFYPEAREKDSGVVDVYLDGEIVSMDLEEYILGVVAAEMPASYELEALKAQAVAARTYTLHLKHNGGCSAHPGADVCTSSSHCQAYLTEEEMKNAWGNNYKKHRAKIDEAVQSTRGEEIYYRGEEIQVFYFSSSGGMTENCANVYQESLPYLVSVDSPGEEGYSNYYGKVTISYGEFVGKMEAFSPGIALSGTADDIGKITRYESGRVQSIRIGDESFTGREIRQIFRLNSTNFTIKAKDEITFSTIGFGHGVGMSQTGANEMAKGGADYIEILQHYFTGVTVE